MLVYLVTIWLSASLSVIKSHWENTQIFKRVHTYTSNSLEMMCKKNKCIEVESFYTYTHLFIQIILSSKYTTKWFYLPIYLPSCTIYTFHQGHCYSLTRKSKKCISLTQVLYIQLKSSVIPGHGTDLGSWPCAEVSGL